MGRTVAELRFKTARRNGSRCKNPRMEPPQISGDGESMMDMLAGTWLEACDRRFHIRIGWEMLCKRKTNSKNKNQ